MALPEWMVPSLMVPLQIIQIAFQLSRSEQQETVLRIVSDTTDGTLLMEWIGNLGELIIYNEALTDHLSGRIDRSLSGKRSGISATRAQIFRPYKKM